VSFAKGVTMSFGLACGDEAAAKALAAQLRAGLDAARAHLGAKAAEDAEFERPAMSDESRRILVGVLTKGTAVTQEGARVAVRLDAPDMTTATLLRVLSGG
jgi:hypothetical protein